MGNPFSFWFIYLTWDLIICSVTQLETVIQLLTNIESCQLRSLSKAPLSQQVRRKPCVCVLVGGQKLKQGHFFRIWYISWALVLI